MWVCLYLFTSIQYSFSGKRGRQTWKEAAMTRRNSDYMSITGVSVEPDLAKENDTSNSMFYSPYSECTY